jgi:hypothetical protein
MREIAVAVVPPNALHIASLEHADTTPPWRGPNHHQPRQGLIQRLADLQYGIGGHSSLNQEAVKPGDEPNHGCCADQIGRSESRGRDG